MGMGAHPPKIVVQLGAMHALGSDGSLIHHFLAPLLFMPLKESSVMTPHTAAPAPLSAYAFVYQQQFAGFAFSSSKPHCVPCSNHVSYHERDDDDMQ